MSLHASAQTRTCYVAQHPKVRGGDHQGSRHTQAAAFCVLKGCSQRRRGYVMGDAQAWVTAWLDIARHAARQHHRVEC
jgi:hypothetical protein